MIKLGNEDRQTGLDCDACLAKVRALAQTKRNELASALYDEGPSVLGCSDGRFLVLFGSQDGSVRVDKYDRTSKRVARYAL